MRPTRLPSTMPCLWPNPERGMITAASPGSPRWIANPVGRSAASPGFNVSGSSRHALRSSPADPAVAYAGNCARTRSSRTLMSSVFLFKNPLPAPLRGEGERHIGNLGNLLERRDGRLRLFFAQPQGVLDDPVGDPRLGRARERMRAGVVVDRDLVLLFPERV